jgi:hypothetical protein
MKLQLAIFTLVLSGAAGAIDRNLVTEGIDPGCFNLPNEGVHSAIRTAEEKAREECDYPVLEALKVNIRQVGGCNPTRVEATFNCISSENEFGRHQRN